MALERENARLTDQICFFCQQSAEKYLKALLQERGTQFARTHDLESLLVLLMPQDPALRKLRRGLEFLTRFAVDTRYPGDDATTRQAQSALRWAARVRDACRALLGLS